MRNSSRLLTVMARALQSQTGARKWGLPLLTDDGFPTELLSALWRRPRPHYHHFTEQSNRLVTVTFWLFIPEKRAGIN